MSSPPDVSVCIINWNGRDVLRNCLHSLDKGALDKGVISHFTADQSASRKKAVISQCASDQTSAHIAVQGGEKAYDPFRIQVIVVDNASSDGSADIVPVEFPQTLLIRNEDNRGFSAANNQAAACATGRYLLFLNNDTVVPPGSLSRLVKFLDENPEAVAVGPQLIGGDGKPQRTGRNLPTLRALLHRGVLPIRWTHLFARQYRDYRHTFDSNQNGPVPQLAAAALLVRPEVFAKAGGWDEQFQFGVEDVDFCQRLAKFGSIQYLADARIIHLGRVSSHLNRPWVFRSYQFGYVKYFRKHHRSKWAPLIYKIGVTVDTPIRLLPLVIKAAILGLLGRRQDAMRSREKAGALWQFVTKSLVAFWRA